MNHARARRPNLLGVSFVVMLGVACALVPLIYLLVKTASLNTDLMRAVSRRDLATLKELLRKGANPNAPLETWNGETVLMRAAANGDARIVKALLENGANPNVRHKGYGEIRGRTAIFFAVANAGDTNIIQALLDKGADLNSKDELGETPLILACEGKREPRWALFLLEKGANPNATSKFGKPALLLALESWEPLVGKELLKRGADPNATDLGRTTVTMNYKSILGSGSMSMTSGSNSGKSTAGQTALMIATRKGYAELVQLLLEKGANANAKDTNGTTALALALERKSPALAQWLKQAGARE